jgi:hypothetical protein
MVDAQELHETQLALDEEIPTGTWSGAPALPSSPATVVNTTEYDIDVRITGGTVTVVKKNGVTLTNVTSANYGTVGVALRLKPGHSFGVTYSVAPTVQYIYS